MLERWIRIKHGGHRISISQLPVAKKRLAGFRCNSTSASTSTSKSASVQQTEVPVDGDGIPLAATYSFTAFLSSLPSPQLTDEQYIHLHKLAALVPPSKGTSDFKSSKLKFQDMIRLVEGVRQVESNPNLSDLELETDKRVSDSRIWPEGEGIPLDWDRDTRETLEDKESSHDGRTLLKLASNTHSAGYYIVRRHQNGDVE